MAVLMMAHNNNNNEAKPIYHDFLGISYHSDAPVVVGKNVSFGGEIRLAEASASASVSVGASSGGLGPVSATSDLGSERQVGNHFEGVTFYGSKSDFSGPEISTRFPGRKRSNLDSTFMGPTRDKMPQTGPDSLESSQLMKILRNEAGGERARRSHNEEVLCAMQPTRSTSTSLVLQPPIGSRPDSVASKWERSMLINAGPMVQYTPLLSQITPSVDKASSNRYREVNTGPSLISQAAADEGSRTGIKGSGILSAINASSGAPDRNSSGVLPSGSKPKSGPRIADPKSYNSTSQHALTSASRQMTVFYAGQAHVFDDVHPNKADVIMALAGSDGGSWSTTYSPKSNVQPPLSEAYVPNGENEIGKGSLALSQELHGRLSVLGNSSHGLSQGGQISTTRGDLLNFSSGAHEVGAMVRDTRSSAQTLEPDTRGKREL